MRHSLSDMPTGGKAHGNDTGMPGKSFKGNLNSSTTVTLHRHPHTFSNRADIALRSSFKSCGKSSVNSVAYAQSLCHQQIQQWPLKCDQCGVCCMATTGRGINNLKNIKMSERQVVHFSNENTDMLLLNLKFQVF
jgi:hypothetical protein